VEPLIVDEVSISALGIGVVWTRRYEDLMGCIREIKTKIEKRNERWKISPYRLIFANPSGEGAYALLGRNHHRKSYQIKYEISRWWLGLMSQLQLSQPLVKSNLNLGHEQHPSI
jgi:hypothetical protein